MFKVYRIVCENSVYKFGLIHKFYRFYDELYELCRFLKTKATENCPVVQLKTLPESVILETTEYKCLKSQYSVLFNEAQQIKSYLDEARTLLQTTKAVHLRHIEQMEVSYGQLSLLLYHSLAF